MPRYQYVKSQPVLLTPQQLHKRQMRKKMWHVIPNALIVIGATTVLSVIYPMLSYNLHNFSASLAKNNKNKSYQNTIARVENNFNQKTPAVEAFTEPLNNKKQQQPIVIDGIDYTKAVNWFPSADLPKLKNSVDESTITYTLSIPKLNIDKMNVVVGVDGLDEHLVQYAGTASPGEYGNPVIFGHSVLPLFNNPKSYLSVFTKVPSLEKGDEIYIDYDRVHYKYVVNSYHEVKPEQVEVLEQRYDRKTLTLITCVPPGTTLRRGVILASLVED